jgi:hypothetical protein
MRYWYILFLNLAIYSSGLKDRLQVQMKKFLEQKSEPGSMQVESPTGQAENALRYHAFCVAHAEFIKNQKTEPKKNDTLRLQEIKVLVCRILQDLEK